MKIINCVRGKVFHICWTSFSWALKTEKYMWFIFSLHQTLVVCHTRRNTIASIFNPVVVDVCKDEQ